MSIERLVIVGAGGHAKVVYEAVRSSYPVLNITVIDDKPALQGTTFLDTKISNPAVITNNTELLVHVAIGENMTRKRVTQTFLDLGAQLFTVQHPAAILSKSACINPGCMLAASAIVGPETEVGMGAIINHAAVVDHDCVLGNWSHIAPRATLGGGVKIGEGVLIGAGAVVLYGRRVSDWAVVGAGAVVTRDVPAGQTVVGVPARARKA
jgi:sugar O-acyltransferase (sialic acid O-acetyltransferase NeuD family)